MRFGVRTITIASPWIVNSTASNVGDILPHPRMKASMSQLYGVGIEAMRGGDKKEEK
jgi:hypothetical protein